MRKNEKKLIFSLGPNGPILQIFLVVQYSVGSLKIPSDGSNNLIFLDQVKRHCAWDPVDYPLTSFCRNGRFLKKVLADLKSFRGHAAAH